MYAIEAKRDTYPAQSGEIFYFNLRFSTTVTRAAFGIFSP
jgi:hypothetical protein